MSKKILSVMLALMLVLSSFAVTAFASGSDIEVENDEEVIESTQYWSLSEATKVSDGVYSVDVSLTTNYVTGAISFRIDSDNGATLTNAVINDAVITYNYNHAFNADGVVAIIPEPANDTDEGIVVDGVIATVTFTLADGTEGDTLTLVNDRKNATNPGGDLVAVRLSDNNLTTGTMIYGQRVINASEEDIADGEVIASVDIGEVAAEPADLAKKATAEAGIVIDTAHTFGGTYKGVVFGFTQAANNTFMSTAYLTNNLEATNEGSLEFSRSIGTNGYGTGTVITVKNADGTEAAKYVVVIFGDVDCNGLINTTDTKNVKKAAAVASTYANNSVQRMAANCQMVNAEAMMHTINTGDTKIVKGHTSGTKIDQAALATKMASLTGTWYK